MSVCLINQNLTKDTQCGYSLPKIVELYLANFGEVTSTTTNQDGNEIATIVLADSAFFYKVDPAINTASFADNLAVGSSGNKYRFHQVGFSYSSAYNSGLVDTIDALSLGKFIGVARMADGSYIMFGRNVGLEADADGVNNVGSGDATAEGGLTVQLSANTVEAALPLSDTAVEYLIGKIKP